MTRITLVWSFFSLFLFLVLIESSCRSFDRSAEREKLVTTYCGRCHHVPDPASLTKSVWEKNIMRKMSEYYIWSGESRFKYANRSIYLEKGIIPMSDTIWSTLQSYFVEGGLDRPVERQYDELPIQQYFQVKQVNDICDGRGITSVTIDEYNQTIIAACDTTLLTLDANGLSINSTGAGGLVSGVFPIDESSAWVLDPGILDPHDRSWGALKKWDVESGSIVTIKTDLSRPVYLHENDANIFISEYGNEKGRLSEYNVETGDYALASNLPGGYKSIIFDYDKDGNDEILVMFAQALEGVYAREVEAMDRSFVPVLSFGPEWGISDMDTLDVNHDGWTDLVVVNGDNADYSMIPKGYHGVRIYLNNKEGRFEEAYNFPLHGATQVQTIDANGDGFEDILVGSFFAIDKADGLMLLMNQGSLGIIDYVPHRFMESNKGRWMVMNKGDVDGDGDQDAIIGSFEILDQSKIKNQMNTNRTNLLILLNQSK